MTDLSHLDAIRERLTREEARLAAAGPAERALRAAWIAQAEREIVAELAFLGIKEAPIAPMSDDELLAELAA